MAYAACWQRAGPPSGAMKHSHVPAVGQTMPTITTSPRARPRSRQWRRRIAMTRNRAPWRRRLPRLFDCEDFPRWMSEAFGPEGGMMNRDFEFLPEANVTESDKQIEVAIDLPGMKPEDVK